MADGSAKSAVLMSGKPGCFIAGADIRVSEFSFNCCLRYLQYFSQNCYVGVNVIVCLQLLSELQVLCRDKINVIVLWRSK